MTPLKCDTVQSSVRKEGSQLCHSCANYSKMNGIRPSAGPSVRSPPTAKARSISSSSVT